MAFDSGSNRIFRPTGLTQLLGYRSASQSGFQAAHIIGDDFWTRAGGINWLDQLEFTDNQSTLNNGVLLPESERGSAILGVAAHFADHYPQFDALFYDSGITVTGLR